MRILKDLTVNMEYYPDGLMINYWREDIISFVASFQILIEYLKYNRLK